MLCVDKHIGCIMRYFLITFTGLAFFCLGLLPACSDRADQTGKCPASEQPCLENGGSLINGGVSCDFGPSPDGGILAPQPDAGATDTVTEDTGPDSPNRSTTTFFGGGDCNSLYNPSITNSSTLLEAAGTLSFSGSQHPIGRANIASISWDDPFPPGFGSAEGYTLALLPKNRCSPVLFLTLLAQPSFNSSTRSHFQLSDSLSCKSGTTPARTFSVSVKTPTNGCIASEDLDSATLQLSKLSLDSSPIHVKGKLSAVIAETPSTIEATFAFGNGGDPLPTGLFFAIDQNFCT